MSIKKAIIAYLEMRDGFVYGGTIEDKIRETYGAKASNASRRCRELVEANILERKLATVDGRGSKVVLYRIRTAEIAPLGNSDRIPVKTVKVNSRSKRGLKYDVIDWGTGFECCCEGFKNRGDCYHIKKAVEETSQKLL